MSLGAFRGILCSVKLKFIDGDITNTIFKHVTAFQALLPRNNNLGRLMIISQRVRPVNLKYLL